MLVIVCLICWLWRCNHKYVIANNVRAPTYTKSCKGLQKNEMLFSITSLKTKAKLFPKLAKNRVIKSQILLAFLMQIT